MGNAPRRLVCLNTGSPIGDLFGEVVEPVEEEPLLEGYVTGGGP